MAVAPYIGLGFLFVGMIQIFVTPKTMMKYLGRGRMASVIYAALPGIPLPLCSCAVLPTVKSLKEQGASEGAAISFLVSTPETGADSVAVTYALYSYLGMSARAQVGRASNQVSPASALTRTMKGLTAGGKGGWVPDRRQSR